MKVQRQSQRNELRPFYIFLIYDETATFDESGEDRERIKSKFGSGVIPEGISRYAFLEGVSDKAEELNRSVMRKAYGHPRLCYFTVYPDDRPITFEFDSDRKYTVPEMKQILRLAVAAKRRCKFGGKNDGL
jgi:hypothetical protein